MPRRATHRINPSMFSDAFPDVVCTGIRILGKVEQ